MAIPSRQIGWSTTDNLLWQISKQVESLGCVVACGTSPAIPTSLNYGLFAQTANSAIITNTTTETSLINGGVGTLTVPANGFSVGDSFRAVFGGLVNANNNQYDKAIAAYTKAIEINPQYAEAYKNRGIVYSDLKDYDKAMADNNKAIEINPQYAEAYNNRGVVYRILKDYDKAIKDYNKAIEINPQLFLTFLK